ncbi:MAG: spinster family MFS transporter [Bryobacteraceae bacterium]
MLTLVYVFSFIDRQILNLLVAPIRRDLAITDFEMSLLMGFSFAIFYTFFGMPMGRLADMRSRRGLIAAGFAAWSLFTAGCGLARNYAQMLLLRMGVGVGEAALSPAAYSMITDYFPPRRLATAISVYSMGIYIGAGLAMLLGGWVIGLAAGRENWVLPLVGAVRTWQVIFFMVGLPGVLLSLLMYTVREPERRGAGKTPPPISEFAQYLSSNWRTMISHNVGFALISFSNYGAAAWIPTFYIRSFGWTARDIGLVLGAITATVGTLGIVAGGRFADWLGARGYRDATMRVGVLVSLAWVAPGVLIYLVRDATLSLVLLGVAQFFTSAPFGVAPAAIQQVMPPPMRGQASAVYLFFVNLIGLGLGPSVVAALTDYVFRDDAMVGWSLLVTTLAAHSISALLLWTGLRSFRESLDRKERWTLR